MIYVMMCFMHMYLCILSILDERVWCSASYVAQLREHHAFAHVVFVNTTSVFHPGLCLFATPVLPCIVSHAAAKNKFTNY